MVSGVDFSYSSNFKDLFSVVYSEIGLRIKHFYCTYIWTFTNFLQTDIETKKEKNTCFQKLYTFSSIKNDKKDKEWIQYKDARKWN